MGVIDPRDERYEDDRPGGIGRVAGAEPSERDEAPRRGEPAADDAEAPPARRRYDDDAPRRREPSAWEQRGGRYDDESRPRRRYDEDDAPRRSRAGEEEVDHRAVIILVAIALGALLIAASGALR